MYRIRIGEKEFELTPDKENSTSGTIDGAPYELDLRQERGGFHVIRNNKSYHVSVAKVDYQEKTFTLMVNSHEYKLEAKDRFDVLLHELGMEDLAGSAINDLKAPMPGMVLEVKTAAGETVKKGDPLVVLEAMKMENVLKAESDARVKSVNVKKGQAVEKNLVLVEFES